ncbi:hypothetical protein MNEG_8935 [Monoraphidium neglectum]|uniref:Uncharacterized protein n=1 Tax=Monoraphidium neglectum TaxID=145388 RepID=A0A0D2MXY2_9CHLO|nr:hypothetical protein MNEG_8935 [Monoraphidium neglectum]KIY99025.1 hypothetical protein MNEG_8935 [Monoraphidium neglectum]|eukprot:XP_013898045.1 hypothetical protein MNEG_8935 [Monoraphidium neglectum]
MHQRQNQRARSATAVAASSQQQQSGAGRGLLPPAWPRVALRLALCGATVGTLLDGIHSAVALQVYDLGPLRLETPLGALDTSLLVPPLLATWYAVMGLLFMAADSWAANSGDAATAAAARAAASGGAARVAAGYALLAANLELSAVLYSRGAGYGQILVALAVTWAASWWLLDRTKQGAALAVLCAMGAPAAELLLMSAFGTWHYSRPDVLGSFVSFVPCCYGGYVPLLAAFTRYLAQEPEGGGAPQAGG